MAGPRWPLALDSAPLEDGPGDGCQPLLDGKGKAGLESLSTVRKPWEWEVSL